jgi:hypothetical protein
MSATATTATPWDYKTVVLTHGFMGFHKDELDRKEFEASYGGAGRRQARGLIAPVGSVH